MKTMARKVDRSMISPSRLLEVAGEALPTNVSWDAAGEFGLTSYEAGMMEVLRGIAQEDLDFGVGPTAPTKEMERLSGMADQKINELNEKLKFQDDIYNLFVEVECTLHDAAMAESVEMFIQGFLRGYRYLKNQMEYRGGYSN